jgi:multiple sugar transport system permease protein
LNKTKIFTYILCIFTTVLLLFPIFWAASTSLKNNWEVRDFPPQWIPFPPVFRSFQLLFFPTPDDIRIGLVPSQPFVSYIITSIIVSVSVTFLNLVICSLAAFAFSRLEFRGREILFGAILATMMIPGNIKAIPAFLVSHQLGIVDSYLGLIIPPAAGVTVTFLLRQFFNTFPDELEEAATIDGCSRFGCFWRIILPNSKGAFIASGLTLFILNWNSFLWPLIVIPSGRIRTLTVGLRAYAGGEIVMANWPLNMAGVIVATLPVLILFVLAHRYFLRGVVLSGLTK